MVAQSTFEDMTIYVETNDGIIPISASPNLKVKAILAAVRNKRTPTDDTHTRSYLILDGSRMHEDRRLVDYDITTGDTLVLSRELIGGKPVIYLMAPEAIDASVELSLIPQWSLSAIYPVVPIKPASSHSLEKLTWRVQIHPNGELTEVTTGLDTAYLFWEAMCVWLIKNHLPYILTVEPSIQHKLAISLFFACNSSAGARDRCI